MKRTHITINEAYEQSGVLPQALRKYCRDGLILGAVKIGKSWRVPVNWIENFGGDKECQLNESQ